MPVPLIGLSTSRIPRGRAPMTGTAVAYVDAVLRAGGLPVLIPVGLPEERLHDLSLHLNGLLLTGGGDIDPQRFGGRPNAHVSDVDPERDQLEINLLVNARQSGLPFLGICRGLQLVNVALGGSLYTDIADQYSTPLKHDNYDDLPRSYLAHSVQIEEGTRLAQIFNAPVLDVNSLHHQGVERVAPGLKVSAHAADGFVEGVELSDHPFGLAVQWHPEWLQEQANMRALFDAFITAAAVYSPEE
jgi:putative glutamine amidotransferase